MNDYSELRAKAEMHMEDGYGLTWLSPSTLLALLDEVERLRAGQELALGVATMAEMLLPAMRDKNVELVNMLVAGLKGSGALLEAALNSSTGQQNAPVAEGDAP